MCLRVGVLHVFYQFLPHLWPLYYRTDLEVQSAVLLVCLGKLGVRGLLVDKRVVYLNLLQWGQDLQFLLYLVSTVQDERLHVHVTEIVWNALVEDPTQLVDLLPLLESLLLLVVYYRQQFVQRVVPVSDGPLTQLPERQSLLVIADLLHVAVHHPDVENQLYEVLNTKVEFRLDLELLVSLLLLVSVVVVIVHLYDLIMPDFYLVLHHLVVVPDRCLSVQRAQLAYLPSHSHPAPAGVHVELL